MFSLAIAHDGILREKVTASFATYHCVAEVNTPHENSAYQVTNSIDSPWWTNKEVKFLGSAEHGLEGARSTCVGDVFEHANGFKVIVGRFGFIPFERPAPLAQSTRN
jgi:hypothetical protein